MTSDNAQAQICAKLSEAASGTVLEVRTHAELAGASAAWPIVEAYVIAVSRGGFQVEMWRPNGREPYRTKRCGDLDEAVAVAVAAATGRRLPAVAGPADLGRNDEPDSRRGAPATAPTAYVGLDGFITAGVDGR